MRLLIDSGVIVGISNPYGEGLKRMSLSLLPGLAGAGSKAQKCGKKKYCNSFHISSKYSNKFNVEASVAPYKVVNPFPFAYGERSAHLD